MAGKHRFVRHSRLLSHIRRLEPTTDAIIPFVAVFSAVEFTENVIDLFGQGSVGFMAVNLGGFASNIHFAFGLFDLIFFEGIFQLCHFTSNIIIPTKTSSLSLVMKIRIWIFLTKSLLVMLIISVSGIRTTTKKWCQC